MVTGFFVKGKNDHFCPSFHQKIACGAHKNASPPAFTLVVGAARPESATRLVSIIPVSWDLGGGVVLHIKNNRARNCPKALRWVFFRPI